MTILEHRTPSNPAALCRILETRNHVARPDEIADLARIEAKLRPVFEGIDRRTDEAVRAEFKLRCQDPDFLLSGSPEMQSWRATDAANREQRRALRDCARAALQPTVPIMSALLGRMAEVLADAATNMRQQEMEVAEKYALDFEPSASVRQLESLHRSLVTHASNFIVGSRANVSQIIRQFDPRIAAAVIQAADKLVAMATPPKHA